MAFFVAGYLVVWALVFLYTSFLYNGQRKLEQELAFLEELVGKQADVSVRF